MIAQESIAKPSNKPALELADIFRQYSKAYLEKCGPASTQQRRVLKAIQLCRTSALGGNVLECDLCGHREVSYHSCRNVHCPKCQAEARAKWLQARKSELLPVEYFHVVFTLPEEFRLIAIQNQKVVYGILFRAAAETLRQVARDPKHLGAEIGFFGILHTSGQSLCHHPHIHFVVPGGGLAAHKTKWISSPKGFFLPINVLRVVFRGKLIAFMKRAFANGELKFYKDAAELAQPELFEANLDSASKHKWAVHSKPPFGGPEQVLKYLARYTHRVAISNNRLISLENGKVTFRWKDYADHNRQKTMTLDVFEFIRRFLLHVLPSGFVRIRYYGLLSTRNRNQSLETSRNLLMKQQECPAYEEPEQQDRPVPEKKGRRCPVCKEGHMVTIIDFGRTSLRRAKIPEFQPADTS